MWSSYLRLALLSFLQPIKHWSTGKHHGHFMTSVFLFRAEGRLFDPVFANLILMISFRAIVPCETSSSGAANWRKHTPGGDTLWVQLSGDESRQVQQEEALLRTRTL